MTVSIAELLSWSLLIAGGLFAMIGGVGILRLPDLFTRMHGAGITDTLGATLVLSGLLVHAAAAPDIEHPGLIIFKLITVLFFLLLSSPAATHALARAALEHDVKPARLTEEDPPSNS